MRRSLSPRIFASSLAVFLSIAAAFAWAETQPQKTPVTSPTKVLKAVQYTGPMLLQDSGNPEGADHSLSPYLYVAGGDPARDQVPLKKTWAEVDIAGVIAAVKVHQIFENTGAKPIEAIYVFPASTRAAVHAMRMKIGARTIEAKIERKAEARAQYEAAKQSGKRASLLEQERPNVFTTSVANIMPGDRIEVELDYSELGRPGKRNLRIRLPDGGWPALRWRRRSLRPTSGWPIRICPRASKSPTPGMSRSICNPASGSRKSPRPRTRSR
jgi:hypothetical protein